MSKITPTKEYHLQYVYKCIDTKTNQYYIGSSHCDKDTNPEDDGYYGSGPTWEDTDRLVKHILLKGFKTIEGRISTENAFINFFISDPLCLNRGTMAPHYHCYGRTPVFTKDHRNKLRKSHHKTKEVIQRRKDDTVIKVWESGRKASLELNIHPYCISQCCQGNQITAGGYKWEFKVE